VRKKKKKTKKERKKKVVLAVLRNLRISELISMILEQLQA